jgi:hypothetical protein
MHLLSFLYPALLAASGAEALRSDKVKLAKIESLTLRKGQQTSARRVDPIPQVRVHLMRLVVPLSLSSPLTHPS